MSENNSQLTTRERAAAAWAVESARREHERAEAAEQERREQAAWLKECMAQVLGLEVEPAGRTITLDGVTFAPQSSRRWAGLHIIAACPKCNALVESQEVVTCWADVGRILETFEPDYLHIAYHCHREMAEAGSSADTATDRLVSALRELLGLEALE